MRKKKRWIRAAAGVLLIASLPSVAYETDRSQVRNAISTASIDINLVESKWDQLPDTDQDGVPDAAQDLHQDQTVTKDPAVKNASTLPVYAFLRVRIPTADVMLVDSAPQITQDVPLFSYRIHNGWKQLSVTEADGYREIWYGYTSKVAVDKTTGTLFDSVAYADVVEGQIADTVILDLQVDAYGIQAYGFSSMDQAFSAFDQDQPAMTGSIRKEVVDA